MVVVVKDRACPALQARQALLAAGVDTETRRAARAVLLRKDFPVEAGFLAVPLTQQVAAAVPGVLGQTHLRAAVEMAARDRRIQSRERRLLMVAAAAAARKFCHRVLETAAAETAA